MQHRASRTAEIMALFRALESLRPESQRLFTDPYAKRFLGSGLGRVARLAARPAGRRALLRVIDVLAPGARASGVARTRVIDDAVRSAVAQDCRQVVILGVGFDSRAYRLPELAALSLFEVDRPATLALRRQRLSAGRAMPFARVTEVPVDFDRDRLADLLPKHGFDASRPTLFLWEGVTNYLSPEGVDATLRLVAASAKGSRLVFTYVHRDVIDRPDRYRGTGLLRRFLRGWHEPWTFGIDPAELADFLGRRGLSLVHDEGSTEVRRRLLGSRPRELRGYEFYRIAIADVP
jgi:methyltransferase (TIGR00027 family)